MWEDPIVSDVRRIREQLAGEYNFDVHAIFEEMRKRQVQLGTRLVAPERAERAVPTDRNSVLPHLGR